MYLNPYNYELDSKRKTCNSVKLQSTQCANFSVWQIHSR